MLEERQRQRTWGRAFVARGSLPGKKKRKQIFDVSCCSVAKVR